MAGVEIALGVLRAQDKQTIELVAAWMLGGVSQMLFQRYGAAAYRGEVRRLCAVNRRWEDK